MNYFDLLESLDQTYPFTYGIVSKDHISGTFEADGLTYEVDLFQSRDHLYTYNDKIIKAHNAEFYAIDGYGDHTNAVYDNIGGSSNPSKIFSTVIHALIDMVEKIKPDAVTLVGNKSDNRPSLYNRLAARFDPRMEALGYIRADISEEIEDEHLDSNERISWVRKSLMEDASVGATSSANIATVAIPMGEVRRRKRLKEDDVTEALDKPKELTWKKYDNSWIAQGEFSDIPYTLGFFYDDKNFVSEETHEIVPLWEISFSKTSNNLDDSIIGGINASEIFATMKAAVHEFLLEKNPDTIQISANAQQPSRIRLYDRFAKMIDNQAALFGYKRAPSTYVKGITDTVEKQREKYKSYVWTRL